MGLIWWATAFNLSTVMRYTAKIGVTIGLMSIAASLCSLILWSNKF